MKDFNVTAQIYRLHDPQKQHILINCIFPATSSEDAIEQFKFMYSPSIEFQIVKIYSAEEIPQDAA